MSSFQKTVVAAAVAAAVSTALTGCGHDDKNSTNHVKCNPWLLNDDKTQSVCMGGNSTDSSETQSTNGTDGTAANGTDAGDGTQWICSPSGDDEDAWRAFATSVKAMYTNDANKNDTSIIGSGGALGPIATGFIQPDFTLNVTDSTNATKVVSADEIMSAILNSTESTQDPLLVPIGQALTSDEWLKAVDPTIAANIAANASADDGSYKAGAAGTSWDKDGVCFQDDSGAEDCTHYLDCATKEEKAAYEAAKAAAAASGANATFFFPEKSFVQKKYCSFTSNSTSAKGKCLAKQDYTNKAVNNTVGTICRGANSVAQGYYCESRTEGETIQNTNAYNGIGEGALQLLTEFVANSGSQPGQLVADFQPCVSDLDCGRKSPSGPDDSSPSFGQDCMDIDYFVDIFDSAPWAQAGVFGMCGTMPTDDDSLAALRKSHPDKPSWPRVANNATTRADIKAQFPDVTDDTYFIPCQPVQVNGTDANGTATSAWAYSAPEILNVFQGCQENLVVVNDTNLNSYNVSSIVVKDEDKDAAYDAFTSDSDLTKAMYDEWGVIFKGGMLSYAQECAKDGNSDCAVDEYCKKRFITTAEVNSLAGDNKALFDALNGLTLPTADTGIQFLQELAQNTLANSTATVCAPLDGIDIFDFQTKVTTSVPISCQTSTDACVDADITALVAFGETKPDDLSSCTKSYALVACDKTDASKPVQPTADKTYSSFVEARNAWLGAQFVAADQNADGSIMPKYFDFDIHNKIVSPNCQAFGVNATLADSGLQFENITLAWNSWVPNGLIQQKMDPKDADRLSPGICGPHGIFLTENDASVSSNKDCQKINAKSLAAFPKTEMFEGYTWQTEGRAAKLYQIDSTGAFVEVNGKSTSITACARQLVDATNDAFVTNPEDAKKNTAHLDPTKLTDSWAAYFGEATSTQVLALTDDVTKLAERTQDTPAVFNIVSQCYGRTDDPKSLKFSDNGDFYQEIVGSTPAEDNCLFMQCKSDFDCQIFNHVNPKIPAWAMSYADQVAAYDDFSAVSTLASSAYTCNVNSERGNTCSTAVSCAESKLDCTPLESCGREDPTQFSDLRGPPEPYCKLNTQLDTDTTSRAWVGHIRDLSEKPAVNATAANATAASSDEQ